jgi:hypothetical protein
LGKVFCANDLLAVASLLASLLARLLAAFVYFPPADSPAVRNTRGLQIAMSKETKSSLVFGALKIFTLLSFGLTKSRVLEFWRRLYSVQRRICRKNPT